MSNHMDFGKYFKIINTEPIFDVMKTVKEDSPYHREASVFEHTMMVCDEFDHNFSDINDDYFVGLFTCLFHDIGKPACRVRKESAARGVYHSFDGHDLVSADMANEIMVRHDFNEFDIARITWMIRHHQTFWCLKDNDKKVAIANVFRNSGVGIDFECFKTFMIADDFGRVCDDGSRTVDSVKHFDTFKGEFLNKV